MARAPVSQISEAMSRATLRARNVERVAQETAARAQRQETLPRGWDWGVGGGGGGGVARRHREHHVQTEELPYGGQGERQVRVRCVRVRLCQAAPYGLLRTLP